MMETILPQKYLLYKGIQKGQTLDTNYDNPCWFAFDIDTAASYAQSFPEGEVYAFELNKDLHLLNILDIQFRTDFWNKCNMIYTDNNTKNNEKLQALLPLGIPSLEAQETFIRPVSDMQNCDSKLKTWASLIYGHRSSSPNNDLFMVKTMLNIYKNKYDGYVQPFDVPTCYHENGLFHKEICLFTCKDIIKSIKYIGSYSSMQTAGSGLSKQEVKYMFDRDAITKEKWDEMDIQFRKATKYKGKEMGWDNLWKHKLNSMFDTMKDAEKHMKRIQNTNKK